MLKVCELILSSLEISTPSTIPSTTKPTSVQTPEEPPLSTSHDSGEL